MSINAPQNVSNYLVPAVGSTSGSRVDLTLLPGEPQVVDFRNLGLSGAQFRPYGVFGCVGNCTIVVDAIGYSFAVAPGDGKQFPAPNDTTFTISGTGAVTLFFVDYPIIS